MFDFSTPAAKCKCLFYYKKQPPVRLPCNALNSSNFTLHCQVCAMRSTICNIGWYRNDFQQVKSPSLNTTIANIVMITNDTQGNQVWCMESLLRFKTLSFDLYGSYFCQVENCLRGGVVHRSNRIDVKAALNPDLPLCINDVISVENHSCAISNCSILESITPSSTQPLVKNRQLSDFSSSTSTLTHKNDVVEVALTSTGTTLAILILVITMSLLVMLFGWLGYRKYLQSMYRWFA